MKNITYKAWVKARVAKNSIKKFFSSEKGGSEIVILVILLVIAVALAIIFRDQLAAWLDSLFNAANDDIENAMSKPPVSVHKPT